MGAKTWMLAHVDGAASEILKSDPRLDRSASERFARRLFAPDRLEPIEDGDLGFTSPPDDEIRVGCLPGLTIVAASEFGIDRPSQLQAKFLAAADQRTVYLHAMHSVVDWFAYAIWRGGELVRSLSLSPDSGILEDIGQRSAFEEPFWAGEHPACRAEDEDEDDPYPLPFNPLDLGETALVNLFGYELEGAFGSSPEVDPFDVTLMAFKRRPGAWWGRLATLLRSR